MACRIVDMIHQPLFWNDVLEFEHNVRIGQLLLNNQNQYISVEFLLRNYLNSTEVNIVALSLTRILGIPLQAKISRSISIVEAVVGTCIVNTISGHLDLASTAIKNDDSEMVQHNQYAPFPNFLVVCSTHEDALL